MNIFWFSLLAIIDKYVVPISQWTWLYQALLEGWMNMIALWINVFADHWTAERAIIASKGGLKYQYEFGSNKSVVLYNCILHINKLYFMSKCIEVYVVYYEEFRISV